MIAIARLLVVVVVVAALLPLAEAVPTVPKAEGDDAEDGAPPEVDKRWFKKWRGERPGLEKGENHFHAPR